MTDPTYRSCILKVDDIQSAYSEDDLVSLSGSMLFLRPGKVVAPQWLENYELCVEYRERFGVPVSLPFWFANGMHRATQLLRESLDQGRRRWILECGPWAGNPPIEHFADVIRATGRSLNSLSLEDSANIWLDPIEWIDPSLVDAKVPDSY